MTILSNSYPQSTVITEINGFNVGYLANQTSEGRVYFVGHIEKPMHPLKGYFAVHCQPERTNPTTAYLDALEFMKKCNNQPILDAADPTAQL